MIEAWVVKYKDGKMVGHGGQEASLVTEAKHFPSKEAALATAAALNEGLPESHLGYAEVERVTDPKIPR